MNCSVGFLKKSKDILKWGSDTTKITFGLPAEFAHKDIQLYTLPKDWIVLRLEHHLHGSRSQIVYPFNFVYG
jgi:hypothetical protein